MEHQSVEEGKWVSAVYFWASQVEISTGHPSEISIHGLINVPGIPGKTGTGVVHPEESSGSQ